MIDSNTTTQRGIAYGMIYPKGWREFPVTTEGEEQLVKVSTLQARQLGRADIVLLVRRSIHETFERLRRQGALSTIVPTELEDGGTIPASMIITPIRSRQGTPLSEAVAKAANGSQVNTEDMDGAEWFYWAAPEKSHENGEVFQAETNFVIPRPLKDGSIDPNPSIGLRIVYTYSYLKSDRGSDEVEWLEQLGYSMVGSFKWVAV